MRVLSPPEAAADAGVVLLPIRCAATARLRGFEVRAGDAPKYCPPSARQFAQLLSGEAASLISGHGLKLWIPLSLDALRRDDSAFVLLDSLAAAELAGDDITFELAASDVLAAVSRPREELLAALSSQDFRIAVSGLSDFASIEAALLADVRISEVRLSAALCSRSAPGFQRRHGGSWLAEAVEYLHDRGLLASALDVSDTTLCQEIIVAGFDLIQGDLVGRPHSVEATVDQMVAALPFGRTLL